MDIDELEWIIWVDESNTLDMESFIRKNIGEPKIILKPMSIMRFLIICLLE
jgi:hypothetical protein